MISIKNIKKTNFDKIPIDPFWNTGDEKELKIHRIHAYPARFPSFITTKALDFAKQNGIQISQIADVFCGCGTVAVEAKRNNIDFWGCDINPVATLIAKAKSRRYIDFRLQKYYCSILESFNKLSRQSISYEKAPERLRYWYDNSNYKDLALLRNAILSSIPKSSEYRFFFLCAFSNILKPTSRWLTKSIKPQVDPKKKTTNVMFAFQEQCRFMINANKESDATGNSKARIINANFLDETLERPVVDMIIASPPYVTSYEYADLHQLSSLWLGFAKDYRDLRDGSIGSLHHVYNFDREIKRLNDAGTHIVFSLLHQYKSKAYSIAKYFLDMQMAAKVCYSMLRKRGMVLFVIGNTEYKGVRIDNARHLAESLENSGFNEILVTKRKISKKILTPYRDKRGRFTTDSGSRKVYSEEFILIGRK